MKSKNLKTIIFSTVVLCGLLVASFQASHLFLWEKQPAKDITTSQSDKTVNNPEVEKAPPVVTSEKKQQTIYNILGSSNKLPKKDQASMDNWRNQIVNLAEQNKDTVFINGFTEDKTVCLTFDDGPDGTITPKILDTLKTYNIKGSFFFLGENVKTYSAVVKRTYNEGNLVLSHSYKHLELSKLSEENVKKQLSLTENAIYNLIGKKPVIIRPPYGDVTQKTIDILNSENYKTVIWSIDTLDWSQKEKTNIAKNVLDNVRPGDIILMHCNEDKRATLDALPLIIQGLQEKGYKFLDLSEMLHVDAYK